MHQWITSAPNEYITELAATISHLEWANYASLLGDGTEKSTFCVNGSKLYDANG